MTTSAPATKAAWSSTLAAAGIGAVGGLLVNAAIAWAGQALLGAPDEFRQLTLPVYGPLTIIGALAGAIGWRLIVNRSRNAARLLTWLVPAVVALSLIPDLMLLSSKSQPGTTVGGVVALMLMHLGVAAVAVPAYRRFMPPRS
ncbi:hypothetical protein AMES_1450 [Amycolatopsis mediterranei S699]|uniref:Uncharacterized protein n=2 Tax=Amycolatopsis mediterranei TaxID=33910 RepID=A0A0H3CY65_AMYMU|nr:DUF6069 family protein [Amycolatopsis mediterranei]ADJ43273.1 conserved hypothetical protein [Amycolatopsis mediterranei U32]AEK39974.1 hypothetical protein RAM_07410 [Amycolatopsis mediterranei S699]AFO74986.1 hypothetical protein AMES_1450 [Amycolatopsis mediterranei S699]AGT82115.1 hypothetical protein B737_1451 [Amycolatopsis mediterranei RB]KDO11138.1 hypothetical protein DV26_09330 [Amycolatopsis mediterranei]